MRIIGTSIVDDTPEIPDDCKRPVMLDAYQIAIVRDALTRRIVALQSAAGDVRQVTDAEAPFRALLDEAKRVGAVLDAIGGGK